MPTFEYRTNLTRSIGALCAGAFVDAIIVVADYVKGLFQTLGVEHVEQYGVPKSTFVFVVAFVVWIVGLTVVGAPFWSLFHRLRWRSWLAAMALGATLTFLVSLGVSTNGFDFIPPPPNSRYSASDNGGPTVVDNKLTSHGWTEAVNSSLLLGAEGVVVGWVVWRTAYRRSGPPLSRE